LEKNRGKHGYYRFSASISMPEAAATSLNELIGWFGVGLQQPEEISAVEPQQRFPEKSPGELRGGKRPGKKVFSVSMLKNYATTTSFTRRIKR
jgi:hypothetical protein